MEEKVPNQSAAMRRETRDDAGGESEAARPHGETQTHKDVIEATNGMPLQFRVAMPWQRSRCRSAVLRSIVTHIISAFNSF